MLTLPHTPPVHVPVFGALRDHQDRPGLELRHVVLPELLERPAVTGRWRPRARCGPSCGRP
jgi:hypothetical protein